MRHALAASLLLLSPALLFASEKKTIQVVITSDSNGQWTAEEPKKVEEDDTVVLQVKGFNFLRYTLDIAESATPAPAAYDFLASYWSTALGAIGSANKVSNLAEGTGDALIRRAHSVHSASLALSEKVATTRGQFTECWVSASAVKTAAEAIETDAKSLDGLLQSLNDLLEGNDEAWQKAMGETAGAYRTALEAYRAAREAAARFAEQAKNCESFEHQVGRRTAGEKVRVELRAFDSSGASKNILTLAYRVNKDGLGGMMIHGGFLVTGLEEPAFEKIQRITENGAEDLFLQKDSKNVSKGAAIFASFEFAKTPGLYFTLGTEPDAPGQRVLAGISAFFTQRLLLTGGAVLGKVDEGKEKVSKDLFAIVKETEKLSGFAAVSVSF